VWWPQIEVLQVGSGGPNSTLQDAEDLLVAACLCRTAGHPGGCLQVQHSSSARRGRFLHSFTPLFTFPTSPGAIGRQGKVSITYLTSILSFPPRGGQFFSFFHLLQHLSARKGRFLNTFFASFQPSPARKDRFLNLFRHIYSICRQEKVSYLIFFARFSTLWHVEVNIKISHFPSTSRVGFNIFSSLTTEKWLLKLSVCKKRSVFTFLTSFTVYHSSPCILSFIPCSIPRLEKIDLPLSPPFSTRPQEEVVEAA
jgi:hypothetical protein